MNNLYKHIWQGKTITPQRNLAHEQLKMRRQKAQSIFLALSKQWQWLEVLRFCV